MCFRTVCIVLLSTASSSSDPSARWQQSARRRDYCNSMLADRATATRRDATAHLILSWWHVSMSLRGFFSCTGCRSGLLAGPVPAVLSHALSLLWQVPGFSGRHCDSRRSWHGLRSSSSTDFSLPRLRTKFGGMPLRTPDCLHSGGGVVLVEFEAYISGQLASFSVLTLLVGSSDL